VAARLAGSHFLPEESPPSCDEQKDEERSDEWKVVSYCAVVVYGRSVAMARSEATS